MSRIIAHKKPMSKPFSANSRSAIVFQFAVIAMSSASLIRNGKLTKIHGGGLFNHQPFGSSPPEDTIG